MGSEGSDAPGGEVYMSAALSPLGKGKLAIGQSTVDLQAGGFEPVSLCGLQELASLLPVERPYLLSLKLRRAGIIAGGTRDHSPPPRLLYSPAQHRARA